MSELIADPPINAVEPRFPSAVSDRLRLRANHLKMLPAIAIQALDIAKDPECGLWDFSSVVERDVTLAADILRMANSVMFGGRPVMNLHKGVVRIGIRACKNLIIASSFSSMMKKLTLETEWIREMLWQHSFTTAVMSLTLNRTLKLGFQGEEFTGGLVHDIGRMLLATCYPESFTEIDLLDFDEGPEAIAREQAVLGTDHCEVGVWFTRKNMMPEPLVDVVRFHHAPERSRSNGRLVALVAMADHMSNYLQRTGVSEGYDPASNPATHVLEANGVESAADRFAEIASTVMETARHDSQEIASGR